MKEYQLKAINYKKELDIMIKNLSEFIDSPRFDELPQEERSLLADQSDIMDDLSEILEERIALFK